MLGPESIRPSPAAMAGSNTPDEMKSASRTCMSVPLVQGNDAFSHRGVFDQVRIETLARRIADEGKWIFPEQAREDVDVGSLDRAAGVGGEEIAVVHDRP